MNPSIYVRADEIKSAVMHRETEILSTAGVKWNAKRTHITCPYPDHGGTADWRWDDEKKLAFCTCNKPGTADNIFDVVMKCEGLADFEATKIRVAELLGRADLIKKKGGNGKVRQRQGVEDLLYPPADQRDDGLARSYLAFRLGVDAADVLMPATPTTGFKALGYFDPPAGDGKPVRVGDYPCVIFGQVGSDGRRHAHRIYVAPGGAGKADLGKTAAGYDRNPKKSARAADGDNTAGRAVLWGDPTKAKHIILCEGIETGAAIAVAFRAEVVGETIAVAAGVSAVGLESFVPYDVTKQVTVAADRDEKAKPSKPEGSRRGEKAAREFGLRNCEAISVGIAMPGSPGDGADWLDILNGAGLDAVRAGIKSAAPFQPTQAEVDTWAERPDRMVDLERIAAQYPLPKMFGTQIEYGRFGDAVWAHKRVMVGKGEDMHEIFVPIFTPFGVSARLKYVDQAEAYGLRLSVQDMAGRVRLIDAERSDFAKLNAAEVRSMLFAAGMRVLDDGEKVAVECMKAAGPEQEILIVRKPGWHELDGLADPVFVCPNGTILGLPSGHSVELSVSARLAASVAQGGTLKGWKDAAAAAIAETDCPHWTLGVIAAFAGPLIGLAGLDTCGINFSGLSSSGKSTAQKLAASAWSKAVANKDSLYQSAKATVNSIEQMASRSTGTVLVLDELAHVSGKEVGKIIYTLAGNVGKRRMSSAATLKESYSWATFAVLSAETSLEEKIRKDDGEWTAGQTVRLPDVDVTGINRTVSAAALERIDGIKTNFGHAGPAFVQAMITEGMHRDPNTIREGINGLARHIAGIGMKGIAPDSAVIRAANVFAILTLAGTLGKEFGLLPASADIQKVIAWAWAKFRGSSDAVALDPEQQAIANIQTWVAERWNVTLHDIDAETRTNREAVGWFDNEAIYIPAHRLIEAAGGTLKEAEVGKALKARECLVRTKSPKHTFVDYVPKVGKLKAYVLSRNEFGRGSERTPLKVVSGGRP
ncbi:DUF927 domain-containing protein [Lichenifustis flavocetrariae]|uniref:DUF927 domain-containing protein n=1 Tax=Lichenifustis flavocetrariae TaxID=2949735 RepID=A0AA41Z340_9HYPH|nr:DUF927 domain-containing protein [Lichenifustis flavocetrariae]MCW6512127.1 DUF927 domain-containing protein [Lichenifustis flavocetrariae]